MSEDLPPNTIMGATLPSLAPPPDPDLDEQGHPVAHEPVKTRSMPSNCRRVYASFRGITCPGDCVGLQPDGTCLCDVVKAANEQGVEWSVEVRWDEYGNQRWLYDGPPLG